LASAAELEPHAWEPPALRRLRHAGLDGSPAGSRAPPPWGPQLRVGRDGAPDPRGNSGSL